MTNETYKALTISQPYASLIVSGDKFVENRKWFSGYTGPLMIHAGKGTQYLTRSDLQRFTTGAIVGVCRMVTCIHLASMREAQLRGEHYNQLTLTEMSRVSNHEHAEGPWCWVLADVVKLPEPVPCVGCLGLWIPGDDVVSRVRDQLGIKN